MMTAKRSFKTYFWMAAKLAITFTILNAIFELLENLFNLGQVRSFIYTPISTLSRLTGIKLPGSGA